MADNITDDSSPLDTSLQLQNELLESEADDSAMLRAIIDRGLQTVFNKRAKKIDANTKEPQVKRIKNMIDNLMEFLRVEVTPDMNSGGSDDPPCGSDDPPCGSDDPPQSGTEFGKYMHKCICKYMKDREKFLKKENPTHPILRAVNDELKETILRYIGCGALGNVNNEFFLEYAIKAKIDSSRDKIYIADCIVHLKTTKEFYVYDWKFRRNKTSWKKNKRKDEDQMEDYVEVVKRHTGNERVVGFMVVFYADQPSADPEVCKVIGRKCDQVVVFESGSLNKNPLPRPPNVE